jgi:hypothetical protein
MITLEGNPGCDWSTLFLVEPDSDNYTIIRDEKSWTFENREYIWYGEDHEILQLVLAPSVLSWWSDDLR